MYDYNDYYNYGGTSYMDAGASSILAVLGTFMWIFAIVSILMIVCMWIIFRKAGKKGWEAIVPVYNIIVMLEITKLPIWYIVLYIIPFANIYVMFKVNIELAHQFGKSTAFGVASVFFSVICLPILAFGKATYNGGINGYQQPNVASDNQYNMNQNFNQSGMQNMNNPAMSQANEPLIQPNNNGVVQPESFTPNVQNVNSGIGNVSPQSFQQPASDTTAASFVQPNLMSMENTQVNGMPATNVMTPSNPVDNMQHNTMSMENTQVNNVNQASIKKCPNCGMQVTDNADSCFMCGHHF